jgi:hypothetical protein
VLCRAVWAPCGWSVTGYWGLLQSGVGPVGIVAPVGEQCLGLGQRIDHQRSALVVAHLPFAEQHDQGVAFAIPGGVKLGVQPAFGAPVTSG